MDIYEEQILEAIRQIKRPDTESIFKLLTMDAATNITTKDTKKIQTLIETSIIDN